MRYNDIKVISLLGFECVFCHFFPCQGRVGNGEEGPRVLENSNERSWGYFKSTGIIILFKNLNESISLSGLQEASRPDRFQEMQIQNEKQKAESAIFQLTNLQLSFGLETVGVNSTAVMHFRGRFDEK